MTHDVGRLLEDLGLEKYLDTFVANDVDIDVLRDLKENDLERLGLSLGHRKKLLRAITALEAELTADSRSGQETKKIHELIPAVVERRQLTVLFVDLVGSTALSGRLDPEDMREVIGAYQNAVAGEVARFEGHVAKFMGDGVLVYFGWPRAYEDEAERAVRAGLSIIETVGKLATSVKESLAARVGIATGLVVVGDLIGEGAAQEEAHSIEIGARGLALEGRAERGQSQRELLGLEQGGTAANVPSATLVGGLCRNQRGACPAARRGFEGLGRGGVVAVEAIVERGGGASLATVLLHLGQALQRPRLLALAGVEGALEGGDRPRSLPGLVPGVADAEQGRARGGARGVRVGGREVGGGGLFGALRLVGAAQAQQRVAHEARLPDVGMRQGGDGARLLSGLHEKEARRELGESRRHRSRMRRGGPLQRLGLAGRSRKGGRGQRVAQGRLLEGLRDGLQPVAVAGSGGRRNCREKEQERQRRREATLHDTQDP